MKAIKVDLKHACFDEIIERDAQGNVSESSDLSLQTVEL